MPRRTRSSAQLDATDAANDVKQEEKAVMKKQRVGSRNKKSTASTQVETVQDAAEETLVKTTTSNQTGKQPPANWKTVYEKIKLYRQQHRAPVDDMGCDTLADQHGDPRHRRYQTLVSLQLSSQTKDEITANAVHQLKSACPDGVLSAEALLNLPRDVIGKCIGKVGFHRRKTEYLVATARILVDEYGGDVPATVDRLLALPGVGPKMAHLAMRAAWGEITGIGVDTHVRRISVRLGWAQEGDPERVRHQLENWLPRELWGDVNAALVGFGQTLCRPVGPMCGNCPVREECPRVGVGRQSKSKSKSVKDLGW